MLKKIITNTFSNYTLKFVQILLNLIAIPVLIKNVGAEGFGIILFANVLVGYFSILDLGISQGLTKFVAEYRAKKNFEMLKSIINTSLFFYFFIGLFVAFSITLIVLFDGLELFNISEDSYHVAKNIFLLAGVLALFAWPKIAMEGAFRGIQKFSILNLTIGIGRVLSVSLAIVLALFGAPLEYIFLAFNLDKLILFFWQYKLLAKHMDYWKFEISTVSMHTFKMIFAFSGWIMLGQIAVMLEYQSDQFILASMVSVSAITTYTIVFFLFQLIQQVSGLAASAVMPAVAETKARSDHDTVDFFVLYGSKYHNVLFVPLVIVCYYMAEPFIRLWVGDKYLEYIWLVQASVLFQLFWQSNAFLGQVYTGIGKSKKTGFIAIFSGVLNVFLSIVFVNYYGLPGVIFGTLLAGVFSVPLVYIYILPDFNLPRLLYLKKIFVETQIPLLFVGLLLYPLSGYFNEITSWQKLILTSMGILTLLYGYSYFFIFEKIHKEKLLALISSKYGGRV